MPPLPTLLFFVFAALTVGAGFWLLLSKNLLHMAFALLLALLGVAAIYVLLFADYLAVAQLMVYVGGVLVLIIFGLMFSASTPDGFLLKGPVNRWLASVTVVLLAAGLGGVLLKTYEGAFGFYGAAPTLGHKAAEGKFTTLYTIGQELITTYVLPFELASVLLLVALVGAAAITRQPPQKP